MALRILVSVAAVLASAVLTLAALVALVQATIHVISIGPLLWRIVAAAADLVLGTTLLVGCVYLATHLAVAVLGVGETEFPPVPHDDSSSQSVPHDSDEN